MRLVAVKYSNGEAGWLNPDSVVNIRPRNEGQGSAVVPIRMDKEIWVDEPPERLAKRIEEAMQDVEYVVEERGKDAAAPSVVPPMEVAPGMWSVPVPMCTIPSKEYRELLNDAHAKMQMIGGYMDEVSRLKKALADARAENAELTRKLKEKEEA